MYKVVEILGWAEKMAPRLGQGLLLEHHMAPIGILIAISRRGIKSQKIGWEGRECRIAIGQNRKSEIPTCESADTQQMFSQSDASTLLKSWCFWVGRWSTTSLPASTCAKKCIIFTTATSPETAILRLAAISDLHLPNLPQIARRGIEGQCRNKYDFHPWAINWVFTSYLKAFLYIQCWKREGYHGIGAKDYFTYQYFWPI